MYDCCFTKDNNWFRYRAAAIIIENDCVLFVGNSRENYYYSVGGGVKMGETAEEAVLREVYEETGLTVSELQICGTKQWTDINKNYRYIVFFYKTNKFTGELRSSDEGKIFWIKREDLTKYVLADGFIKMLEVF